MSTKLHTRRTNEHLLTCQSDALPTALVNFNAFCQDQEAPLDSIPDDHLPLLARLVHESDKSIKELAKHVKKTIFPSEDSEGSAAGEKLPLDVLEKTISEIAERTNYGLSPSDLASSSSTPTSNDSLPAGLQIWRWEVRDQALLQSEKMQEIMERKEERKAARNHAIRLVEELPFSQREQLLNGRGKKKSAKPSKSASTNGTEPVQALKGSSDKTERGSPATAFGGKARSLPSAPPVATEADDPGASPIKTASEAGSKADSGVIVIDDEDDEEDRGATNISRLSGSPETAKKRKKAQDANDATDAGGNPRKKRGSAKKKEEEESPEQRAEREKKEAEKEEKRVAREVREAEKQAKEAKKQRQVALNKKSASILSGFFGKASPNTEVRSASSPSKEVVTLSDYQRAFAPIVYKDLAPINRFNDGHNRHRAQELDRVLSAGDCPSKADLLSNLTDSKRSRGSQRLQLGRKRSRLCIRPPVSVRETMRLMAESDLMTDTDAQARTRKAIESLQDRRKVPLKLLQFATDMRPGWFGTWTRPSNMISGRRPLRQDPVALDYNCDSEAEWVEGDGEDGKGDDVGDDDNDQDDAVTDTDADSEMDDWLVDDLDEEEDHTGEDVDENMSDIFEVDRDGRPLSPSAARRSSTTLATEPPPAAAATPAPRKVLLPGHRHTKQSNGGGNVKSGKKKTKKVVKNSRRFTQKLVPVTIGPCWEEVLGEGTHPSFAGYQIEFLNDAHPGLNPFTFTSSDVSAPVPAPAANSTSVEAANPAAAVSVAESALPAPAVASQAAAATTAAAQQQPLPVPEDILATLLKTLEGKTENKPVLVDLLAKDFKGAKGVTKKALTQTLDMCAVREGKKAESAWRVRDGWRQKVGLGPVVES